MVDLDFLNLMLRMCIVTIFYIFYETKFRAIYFFNFNKRDSGNITWG